jgi:hypothetical protein
MATHEKWNPIRNNTLLLAQLETIEGQSHE